MKNPLVKVVKDFLSDHYQEGKPILLGYSGGVDSTALLSLLLECKYFFSLDLRVVHFDHAWREESSRQALEFKKNIESLGLKFYSIRSSQTIWKESNKEEKAREERYLFFEDVYKEIGAQALVLAHQREDLAETVLKRFFEGSGILSLGGMQAKSLYQDMIFWRPLLFVSRKQLIEWNEKKNLIAIVDSTNEDLQFLRPRMRQKIFPEIERWFGKGVQKNIALLGEEFSLLKEHMRERLKPFLSQKIEGPLGFALLSEVFSPLDPFEKQELIKACLQEVDAQVGREGIKNILSLMASGVFDKRVDVSKGELIVDGGNVFWLAQSEGYLWQMEGKSQMTSYKTLLQAFFKGEICYKIFKGDEVSFCDYASLNFKDQKRFSSFFSQNKIPATMRKFFPFIKRNEIVIDHSFLFNVDLFIEENEDILNIKLKNISN